MHIALVHDYLREYGGAERVVEVMHEIWPDAPLYTSFVDWKGLGKHAPRFAGWDIRQSWISHVPLVTKVISPLRFLAPSIWSSFDLSSYDIVLSSSGWFMCRGVALKHDHTHVCYIHHPPRHMYGYPTGSTLQKYRIVRYYAAVINFFLRHYDFSAARAVDYFIANSHETARRVEKFYRRKSTVIYPPIELPVHSTKPVNRTYYLSVGRLTYAKRVDLAILAANRLSLPLCIVGVGKDEAYLKSLAGPTVTFVGSVSDEELERLYSGAKALIFCALDEDFGMVPVEAMAQGTPVIALASGGVKETILAGKTGIFFNKPTVDSLVIAIEKSKQLQGNPVTAQACRTHAATFGKERFKKELVSYVMHAYNTHTPNLRQ